MDIGNVVSASENSPPKKEKTFGEKGFEFFCAILFLSMISLVFLNAFLRYAVRGSLPASEEWARFLFIYIIFFGGIEAFYRNKHIAVDLLVSRFGEKVQKVFAFIASALTIGVLGILLSGSLILIDLDWYSKSTATNTPMPLIHASLAIMCIASILIKLRDIWWLFTKPFEKA